MAEREGSPVARSSAQSTTKQDAAAKGCDGSKSPDSYREMQLRN